jgi:protein-disulfide isomerase
MIKRKRNSFFSVLLLLTGFAASNLQPVQADAQTANANVLSRESILRDPEAPVVGNPKGDVTIVEWFDYQCPYCKKMNPDLLKAVHEDGHIRLVLKDWPVFGDVSVRAAKLVLASKYQNKYAQAHDALMAFKGKLTDDLVKTTLAQAGVDVARAERDLATHKNAIDALLARNNAQAEALGFQGTPALIVGHFRVPGALNAANLKLVIGDARAAAKQRK